MVRFSLHVDIVRLINSHIIIMLQHKVTRCYSIKWCTWQWDGPESMQGSRGDKRCLYRQCILKFSGGGKSVIQEQDNLDYPAIQHIKDYKTQTAI